VAELEYALDLGSNDWTNRKGSSPFINKIKLIVKKRNAFNGSQDANMGTYNNEICKKV
jgi:hypothetical protein